jgi:hypothetical protein
MVEPGSWPMRLSLKSELISHLYEKVSRFEAGMKQDWYWSIAVEIYPHVVFVVFGFLPVTKASLVTGDLPKCIAFIEIDKLSFEVDDTSWCGEEVDFVPDLRREALKVGHCVYLASE